MFPEDRDKITKKIGVVLWYLRRLIHRSYPQDMLHFFFAYLMYPLTSQQKYRTGTGKHNVANMVLLLIN